VAAEIPDRLRAEVARRAGFRCEYCLILEGDAGFRHQVDHIISRKHGGGPQTENLAYACVLCNRAKGADIAALDPVSGNPILLFNPRADDWAAHFGLEGGEIVALTRTGLVTSRLLRFNLPERIAERELLVFRADRHST
jgi:hypothetical protein